MAVETVGDLDTAFKQVIQNLCEGHLTIMEALEEMDSLKIDADNAGLPFVMSGDYLIRLRNAASKRIESAGGQPTISNQV